jgi:alkylation response protein AidB-like acyl-CoA dehydrogenase
LPELCDQLANLAPELEAADAWPAKQLRLCADYGVYEWFIPKSLGGAEWNSTEVVRGYLALSAACLTTTFVITQYMGACRRIAISENQSLRQQLLPALVRGEQFATVGISHLTTSRRHLKKPVLRAEETESGFRLEGFSPWVTGGCHADLIVIGATLEDDRQLLLALPTDLPGVEAPSGIDLVGLTASQTGKVECHGVEVPREQLLAGPEHDVMSGGSGAGTGGLQTSTLAVGLADAAIRFMFAEAEKRPDMQPPADQLRASWNSLRDDLLASADGNCSTSNEEIRTRANSLVLRATQAALTAAKGSGYVIGHPAGRWCREALFFLVWSCPQPVLAANLCEFAGLGE